MIPVVVGKNDVFDVGQIQAEFACVIEHGLRPPACVKENALTVGLH
jgi:hypothetical protein